MAKANRQRKRQRTSELDHNQQRSPAFRQRQIVAALSVDSKGGVDPAWFCACGHLKLAHYRITNSENVETIASYCTAFAGLARNRDGSLKKDPFKRCGCRHDFGSELGRAA